MPANPLHPVLVERLKGAADLDGVIAVDDVSFERPWTRAMYEADDGSGGMTHADFAHGIGAAVGRRVLPLPLPRALLSLAARADHRFRGDAARLTADRVAYFCHPDWTIDPLKRPPPALWTPRIDARAGLAETVRWYRARGLL